MEKDKNIQETTDLVEVNIARPITPAECILARNIPMRIETLQFLAVQRSAIGNFDYSTAPNGEIDWYRLRYAWQDGTPMQIVESNPIAPLSEPIPETIPTEKHARDTFADLANIPFQNIPESMRAEKSWCVWQRQPDGRKLPFTVLTGGHWSRSQRCSAKTPAEWVSFDEALHFYWRRTCNATQAY